MTSTTINNNKTGSSAGIGTKLKGGVQVAKGLGDTVRGTTMGAVDTIEHRDSSLNDEMVRRGRMEIEQGISMIKGHPVDTTSPGTVNTQLPRRITTVPADRSKVRWGGGINGANANATTNSTGLPPPKGQEYAQNSTTAPTDLGRGPNAYSGSGSTDTQPPGYPIPGGPPPEDYKGMGHTNPTQLGNRPVGEQNYEQRRDLN
ncbi:hypothetical protein C8R43DRAFT_1023906 [Mycena crocata]|nr:hypothetical protein C8R43DRAFT_1023906 [Mycena crocata]